MVKASLVSEGAGSFIKKCAASKQSRCQREKEESLLHVSSHSGDTGIFFPHHCCRGYFFRTGLNLVDGGDKRAGAASTLVWPAWHAAAGHGGMTEAWIKMTRTESDNHGQLFPSFCLPTFLFH